MTVIKRDEATPHSVPIEKGEAAGRHIRVAGLDFTEGDVLLERGILVDGLRLCAFPFADEVAAFIAAHKTVYVVEQNRDAQMRQLLVNELEVDPARLVPVLHFDGTPITARFITRRITEHVEQNPPAAPKGVTRSRRKDTEAAA